MSIITLKSVVVHTCMWLQHLEYAATRKACTGSACLSGIQCCCLLHAVSQHTAASLTRVNSYKTTICHLYTLHICVLTCLETSVSDSRWVYLESTCGCSRSHVMREVAIILKCRISSSAHCQPPVCSQPTLSTYLVSDHQHCSYCRPSIDLRQTTTTPTLVLRNVSHLSWQVTQVTQVTQLDSNKLSS